MSIFKRKPKFNREISLLVDRIDEMETRIELLSSKIRRIEYGRSVADHYSGGIS